MRAFLRLQNREQAWAYVPRDKKLMYIRVAIKKLDEEEGADFADLKPYDQLQLVIDRAKEYAIEAANDDSVVVALSPEGQVLDEEGNVDLDAVNPNRPTTFGDGTPAEVGETRDRGRAGTAKPKTFGK